MSGLEADISHGTFKERTDFIIRHTRLLQVPHAPEISLHVADDSTELWQRTEEELGRIGLAPPFWAFAWAGGQGLARHVLDHPEWVRGKSVLDFAAGSGLVGIAAMKAGAASVACVDIDAYAEAAITLNARANGVVLEVTIGDIVGQDRGWDIVLAGDIFYDRPVADRLAPWFASLRQRGAEVLVGDPGRACLPKEGLEPMATYQVPVTRDLEDAEIKKVGVWRVV